MINNRQAGRRRGRGGNNGAGGGGGGNPRQGGNPGRGDGGNRIDNRARGNAAQMLEKYKNLARDAQLSGDRVNIEYYLQFADHYFRVLSEQRSRFEESQPRRQQADPYDDGYDGEGDDDFGQEGDPIRANDQGAPIHQDDQGAHARDGNRDDGRRDGRNDGNRSDGNRNDGNRSNGYRQERGEGGRDAPQRDDGSRSEGSRNRDDQPARYADRPARAAEGGRPRRERFEQPDAQPREVAPVQDAPAAIVASPPVVDDVAEPQPEAPRRRGRPRRDAAPVEQAATFEADRLPPSLSLSAVAVETPAEEDAPKPRRRRTPRAEASAAE